MTQSILKLCARTLSDVDVHVRLKANEAFTAVLTCVDVDFEKLAKKYMKLARNNSADAALAKRQGGILGLSAMVSTCPYTVPDHLPAVLAFLTDYAKDPAPVKKHLQHLFAEFRRTHRDEWPIFKEKFTEEQLDAISTMQMAPSYFA